MGRTPLRFQFYATGAILLLSAAGGLGIKGISAALGVVYVMPRCEAACRANGTGAIDFIIRMGHNAHSTCECANGTHLLSEAGDAAGAISFFVIALIAIASSWLLLFYVLRKREAARLQRRPGA
jgi:hypothetical protein